MLIFDIRLNFRGENIFVVGVGTQETFGRFLADVNAKVLEQHSGGGRAAVVEGLGNPFGSWQQRLLARCCQLGIGSPSFRHQNLRFARLVSGRRVKPAPEFGPGQNEAEG